MRRLLSLVFVLALTSHGFAQEKLGQPAAAVPGTLPTKPAPNTGTHNDGIVPVVPANGEHVVTLAPKKYADFSEKDRTELLKWDEEIKALTELDEVDFHKEVRNFALSPTGLNQARFEATNFAEAFCDGDQKEAAHRLIAMKKLLAYSTKPEGLNKSPVEGRTWALETSKRTDALEYLVLHRNAREYAGESTGLNLSPYEAITFADKVVKIPEAAKKMAIHKKWKDYAATPSPEGLNMSPYEAAQYATKKTGFPCR